MTKPLKWPKNSEWAREDSLSLAMRTIEMLKPVIERTETMGSMEILRRTAQAVINLQEIVNKLQAVGPGKDE